MNYNNGGWYKNPGTGKVQQYWNGGWYDTPVTGTVNGRNYEVNPLGSLPGDSGYNSNASAATSNPLQDINKMIEDQFQKLQTEAVQKFGEYKAGNPFVLDDVLAAKTKSATEQIDPYYKQLLGDYMDGVQRKISRGQSDTTDLLNELTNSQASTNSKAQVDLEKSINSARQGYADAGLLTSGDAIATEGQATQSTNQGLTDYNRKVGVQTKQLTNANNRNILDTNTDSNIYNTNLEANKLTDINTRASQLTKEAGQQYVQGYQATLPPQLQSASGFDMLKSLGIYS